MLPRTEQVCDCRRTCSRRNDRMKSLSCFRGGVAAQIHTKNGREEHGLTMKVQGGDTPVASSQGVEEVGV